MSIRNEIQQALVRYCRALDEPRSDVAFVKLWGVLEFVTDSSTPRADTVKRATFRVGRDELDTDIVTHLRDVRNRSVHVGFDSEYSKTLVRQLRLFVEPLLLDLIRHGNRFESLSDFGEMLGLLPQSSELEAQIEKRRRAIDLLSQ